MCNLCVSFEWYLNLWWPRIYVIYVYICLFICLEIYRIFIIYMYILYIPWNITGCPPGEVIDQTTGQCDTGKSKYMSIFNYIYDPSLSW